MCTASSQACTCFACASASEYTATVRMPSRRAVAATRQAISPRLAIRILVNIVVSGVVSGCRRPGRRPAEAALRQPGVDVRAPVGDVGAQAAVAVAAEGRQLVELRLPATGGPGLVPALRRIDAEVQVVLPVQPQHRHGGA